MSNALKGERDALVDMTTDMRGQTETMANAVGRHILIDAVPENADEIVLGYIMGREVL